MCLYLRGRPLIILGGGGKIENEHIIAAGMPFENYFEIYFFPGEGLPKFYLLVFMPAFMYQQTVNNPNFSDFYDT